MFGFSCTKLNRNLKCHVSFYFCYGRRWPNFSKKWECEIWIMLHLHDYKLRLHKQCSALLCSLLSLFFLFCVIALGYFVNTISLHLGLHIKCSVFKLELFVKKSKSFLFVFYCKMMQIHSFPAYELILICMLSGTVCCIGFSSSGELGSGNLNRVKHVNQVTS